MMNIQYAMYRARIKRALERKSRSLNGALAVLVVLLAGCNGGTVDNHALQRDAEAVASLATEGQLLAHDVAKGASTKMFVRVHTKELSLSASDLEDALGERSTSPGITDDVRRLSRLAGKYTTPFFPFELVAQGDRIALAGLAPQPLPLARQTDGIYLATWDPQFRMVPGAGCRVRSGAIVPLTLKCTKA